MDIRNFFGGGGKKTPASNKKKPPAAEKTTKAKESKDKDDGKSKDETKQVAVKNANDEETKPNETEKPPAAKKKTASMEQKRQALLESSDDESIGKPAPVKTAVKSSPAKSKKVMVDLNEEFKPKSSPKKRESSPTRTSPRKRKGPDSYSDSPKKVKEEKKKRKIYDSSDEDMDEDFKADDDDFKDESDEDFMEEDVKPEKAPPKTTKKRATFPAKKAPAKKTKVEEPTIPKYHPPSSRITTVIPFLKDDPSITIQPPTKLVMKGRTLTEAFNVDDMTPLCLEGLTFVFSGILTTNAAKSAAANTAVAIGSPTKGEYYSNRNAYTTSTMMGSDEELPRDIASDLVKMLGGRVTGSVSGKTDYLVVGSILEDGRDVEEGSKHRKCVDLYETWGTKYKNEYNGGKKKSKTKGSDPNSLVEMIRGVDEFWGLINFMSDWKKSTLPEEERARLEASQSTVKKDCDAKPPAAMTASAAAASASAPAVKNPYATQQKPVNPYAKAAAPANPHAKSRTSPANPYAKKTTTTSAPALDVNPAATATSKSKPVQINALWADKYAPSNSKEILGNADSVTKLFNWLRNWEDQFNNPKKKPKSISGPNGPWKAALLSGPPGIGKTTTATLVAQESNRDVIELNASDARSKKALTEALGDLSGTHALSFGNADGSKKSSGVRKRCIVMDEVDGMGAGDRSGMSELIQMIKKAKVPIICICNDRSSQKMRSLVQYCMDLRYRRPTKNVIARRAVEVGKLEGMSVEPNAAEALSESCGNDIRQVLNCLQMWSSKKNDDNTTSSLTFKALSERKNAVNKDEVLRVSMFDACKLIIEGSRNISNGDPKAATASLIKRSDAYFVDYMLMGLNVHQNYLKVALGQFNNAKLKGDETTELAALDELHEATMAMSDFGVCEDQLRGADQNWSLLPLCAMLAVKVRNHCIVGVLMPASPTFVVLSNSGGPSCRWSKRRLFAWLSRICRLAWEELIEKQKDTTSPGASPSHELQSERRCI
ncbi:hypothetical protein ACHAXN_012640 [Cyclotella atomus]